MDESSQQTLLGMPSQTELGVQHQLRAALVHHIEVLELSQTELADRLGILPAGSRALLESPVWSLETCFRVADAIGLKVTVLDG